MSASPQFWRRKLHIEAWPACAARVKIRVRVRVRVRCGIRDVGFGRTEVEGCAAVGVFVVGELGVVVVEVGVDEGLEAVEVAQADGGEELLHQGFLRLVRLALFFFAESGGHGG